MKQLQDTHTAPFHTDNHSCFRPQSYTISAVGAVIVIRLLCTVRQLYRARVKQSTATSIHIAMLHSLRLR